MDRLWMRYDQGLRTGQGSFPKPVYKYEGYMRGQMLPRGADGRQNEFGQEIFKDTDTLGERIYQRNG